jgi:hypothetical protein
MEPTSEEVREVYAYFGLAYYMAEVMHRGLCDLFVLEQLPDRGVTRPRLEELYSLAFSSTIGFLATRLADRYPEDVRAKVREAVERRNFLAHHFWYDRIHLMMSSEGCSQLVGELTHYRDLFKTVDEQTDQLVEPQHARLKVPKELIDRAMADAMAGEPFEPLLKRRELKKQEIVTKAYRVPLESGAHHLIFQTKDGCLWMLCEIGLGWSTDESPQAGWSEDSKIQEFLPATINPRPHTSGPWHYDLPLGHKAMISVRNSDGKVTWRINRTRS